MKPTRQEKEVLQKLKTKKLSITAGIYKLIAYHLGDRETLNLPMTIKIILGRDGKDNELLQTTGMAYVFAG